MCWVHTWCAYKHYYHSITYVYQHVDPSFVLGILNQYLIENETHRVLWADLFCFPNEIIPLYLCTFNSHSLPRIRLGFGNWGLKRTEFGQNKVSKDLPTGYRISLHPTILIKFY